VRVAYEALAGVLGGTQSLHTNSMDEVMALPSEKSVEIALRTQQVLAYETNVTNVIDPLGGSYFVEALTDEMERQAEDYFRQIEEFGGVVEAIEAGFFQHEIADASYRYQRSLESKERIIVGVNAFVKDDAQEDFELLKIPPEMERGQARSVAAVSYTHLDVYKRQAFLRERGGPNVKIDLFRDQGRWLHRSAFEQFAALTADLARIPVGAE